VEERPGEHKAFQSDIFLAGCTSASGTFFLPLDWLRAACNQKSKELVAILNGTSEFLNVLPSEAGRDLCYVL
jgi:hypothetical protein